MKRTRMNRRKPPKRELPKLPPLPRPRVNWGAVSVLISAGCVLFLGFALGREMVELPVRRLEIEGSLQRVSELEIEAAIRPIDKNLVGLDLDALRERVEAITWVDRARLQRVWPDTLRVVYKEHRAAARWGENGLLNTRGELFAEDVRHEYRELPRLAGPEGSHERVARRYLKVADAVAGTHLRLETVRMDARGAFSIGFAGGLEVRIGRTDVDERIDRFFGVAFAELLGEIERARYVDMRYPNGFAVGWYEETEPESRVARLNADG